jgi:putative ABC transport system permease protein
VRLPWGPREENPILTVIGVVGRVKLEQLSEQGGDVQAYLPFLQTPRRGMTVVVKTSLAPDALIALARREMLALDPEQPIHQVSTLLELRRGSIASQRLNLTLLGAFAAVALALAIIGLYGVLAYAVAQRTHEIGIRIALGAQAVAVLRLVIGQGMKLALMGVVIGMIAAFALTRLIQNLLFGVSATDPITFILVAGLFLLVALLACWMPARRATKVDPMVALRVE